MKITLIPKRKLTPELEKTLASDSLNYYANVTEDKLAKTTSSTDLDAHEVDTTTHGATGAIVGTTDSQTLTNKTLTSPVVNGTVTTTGLTLPAHTLGGDLTLNAKNLVGATSTGTKIGTATNQLFGFYNTTPVDQPATVSDPTGGVTVDTECRAAVIALIDRLQELGLIA